VLIIPKDTSNIEACEQVVRARLGVA
ncbi:arginine repressor, partial [Vibrio sp. 10N.222.55.E8]